jgi:IS5 family transposase
MRQERTVQANIFDVFAKHEIGRELKAMSDWLDAHRALLGLVVADLARCTWRGLTHFEAYVWSSVVAYNLALFARLRST